MPDGVVIAGPSAAWLHGVRIAADFDRDVHVIAPPGVRVCAQRGVRVHVTDLDDDELTEAGGRPLTTAGRTAWDIGAWLPPTRSVPILDAMLRHGVVTRSDLDGLARRYQGRRGHGPCRLAFDIAGGACGEPSASSLRARLMLEGIPAPELKYRVLIGAELAVVPGMAWPRYRVAIEYDAHRTALLTAAGWLIVHAPPTRVRTEFPVVLRELRQCLHRRGAHVEATR